LSRRGVGSRPGVGQRHCHADDVGLFDAGRAAREERPGDGRTRTAEVAEVQDGPGGSAHRLLALTSAASAAQGGRRQMRSGLRIPRRDSSSWPFLSRTSSSGRPLVPPRPPRKALVARDATSGPASVGSRTRRSRPAVPMTGPPPGLRREETYGSRYRPRQTQSHRGGVGGVRLEPAAQSWVSRGRGERSPRTPNGRRRAARRSGTRNRLALPRRPSGTGALRPLVSLHLGSLTPTRAAGFAATGRSSSSSVIPGYKTAQKTKLPKET
ncbi:hypothetical protein THAOC_23924, partial [Thalassiosira oceanica]